MANRTEPGYSNRMELVTPRSGANVPDGTGRYLTRGDIIAANDPLALENRGMFMRAPDGSVLTPTSERTDTPKPMVSRAPVAPDPDEAEADETEE